MCKIKFSISSIIFSITFVCVLIVSGRITFGRVVANDINVYLENGSGIFTETSKSISIDVSYGLLTQFDTIHLVQDGPRTLEITTKVEVEKTIPTLIYPLKHLHTVAYYPYEEVIRTPHPLSGCQGCLDCSGGDTPTCGWTYNGSNQIYNSQGFCTVKNEFELEYTNCTWWRGEDLIGQQANAAQPFATAHCLRLGDLYFHGYEICEPTEFYEILFKMTQGSEEEEFSISPNAPVYSENSSAIGLKYRAELLGHMEKYKSVPDLCNYILYIPSAPSGNPIVDDFQNNMLLLPREELSKDGSELDKVGISFSKFRKLASSVSVSESGDGLHNQLFHKQNSDLEKLIMNPDVETEYLVHGKRDFKRSMEFVSGMKKILQYKVPEINFSTIDLQINVDSVVSKYIESSAYIVEAFVDEFSSMSEEGVLSVKIANDGDFKSDYIVTVTDMNTNIVNAIPAQAIILEPYEECILLLDIFTAYNIQNTNKFKVTLKSPTGRKYDEVYVVFDTKKHKNRYSFELTERNEGSMLRAMGDITPPVITLNGEEVMTLECNKDIYIEPNAVAIDDVDGDVPVEVAGDEVDTAVCGIYYVKYRAVDSACNFAQAVRKVRVVCPSGPVIAGDVNLDNKVDMEDLGILAGNWLVGANPPSLE